MGDELKELEDFESNGPCVKCGSVTIDYKYLSIFDARVDKRIEQIENTCLRCGHVWHMKAKDNDG